MIPQYCKIIYPLLKLMAKEEQTRKGASEKLSTTFNLAEDEKQKKTASGFNLVFENRVGWAFTFLTKAEYIELTERKAVYRITNLGLNALKDAEERKVIIDTKYLKENAPNYFKNWQLKRKDNKSENEIEDEENNVVFDLEDELDKVDNEFNFALLRKIKTMSWQEFEDLCATLLEKMGYGVASKRQIRVNDGGIDGEIFEDELGLKRQFGINPNKLQSIFQ